MIVVLSIAGSDPTGGAGIQADLKTFAAHGVHGTSVVTAVTAQNSRSVRSIHELPAGIVEDQIHAVFEEFEVRAVKIGMLPSRDTVEAVARALAAHADTPRVIDPVMRASAGQELTPDDAVMSMRALLFPGTTVVTPNCDEAAILAGLPIDSLDAMRRAAEIIVAQGPRAALIKGGHASFAPATDLLHDGRASYEFAGAMIDGYSVHGAGCTLSSAIASNLAKGMDTIEAVMNAKQFVARGIATAPAIGGARRPLGNGRS